ncbi:hypothetical protein DL93DRAFT_440761 [Clavulina sp. PMI_390]|nr:hypothetical protein DL93DRAFT_440761 [Clavulina sp. PMI_390]
MCIPILYTVGILTSVSFTIVQVVVSLRTYALYDCNKPLLAALLILSGASLINLIYWSTGSHHIVPNHLPAPYNGCLMIADHYDPQWARYIPLMVFEGVVMFLTTVKFMIYLRSRTPSIIPAILYRDGYMGFIAILISNLFGLIILSVRPRPLITVSQMCAPILAPVLITNHMLLNLRDVMRLSTPPSEGASNLFELDTNSSPEAPTQVFSFDLSTDHAVVESKPLDIRQSGYYNQASFPGDRPTARHRAREVQLPPASNNASNSFDGMESWNRTP